MRFALIENESSTVVNVIILNNVEEYPPTEGITLIQSDVANIGDFWDGTNFIPPNQ